MTKLVLSPAGLWQRAAFTVVALAIWWALSSNGFLARFLIPTPGEVLSAADRLGASTLAKHTMHTAMRSIVGLAFGSTIGIIIGLGMRFSTVVRAIMEPMVDSMRPVPPVALVPFFILVFGFAEHGRLILVALAVAVLMAVATAEAIENMPEAWSRYAIICGVRGRALVWRVVLPGLVPFLKGPVRVALSVTMSLVIVSEFMGAQAGLGYLVNVSRVNLSTDVIVLAILLLGGLVQGLDKLLTLCFDSLAAWYSGLQG